MVYRVVGIELQGPAYEVFCSPSELCTYLGRDDAHPELAFPNLVATHPRNRPADPIERAAAAGRRYMALGTGAGRPIWYSLEEFGLVAAVAVGLFTCTAIIYYRPTARAHDMCMPMAYVYHANIGTPADSLDRAVVYLRCRPRDLFCVYAYQEQYDRDPSITRDVQDLVDAGIPDRQFVRISLRQSGICGNFGIDSAGNLGF